MRLILNVPRNIFPDSKKAGDLVEINDNLALRWINAGIAHYPGIWEVQKSNKFIFATKKRQGEPLKLNIICGGLMFGYSGFAEAMRNIVYSLYYKGCNVTAQPHDSISTDILNTEKGRVINSLHNIVFNNNYKTVQITMTSPLGVIHRGSAYRIGYVMFETQETPKVFIDSLMINTDELWVPSTFNLNNFTKAGYTHPIFAMPLGVDIDRFNPDTVKPLNIGTDNKFTFLSIMGWSARKGVDILMEAYLREFSSADNTVLYLKGGWYTHEKAQNEVAQIVSKIGKVDPPEIKIDFNLYNDSQLPGLYKSANCFVLASLGEGWGLDYSEAMAMALPTIGTRCTSQLDFMNDKNSFLIDVAEYRPEQRCDWICPQYRGQNFAIPSMTHLQQLMRQIYSDKELADKKGKQARKDMIKKFQWKHAANKWYRRLKDLEANL
ncbi:MAG: glycosyltransferase family 4 protein [Candidatus Humimicrobiaceae bacterium]